MLRKGMTETESENCYRELFETLSLAIFQTTLDGKFITVNPEFARMFGYTSPQELIATIKYAADVFADPKQRDEVFRLKAENPDQSTFESLYRRKDGSTFLGKLTVQPRTASDGTISYFNGFIEEITGRARDEREMIRRLLMQLSQRDRQASIGRLTSHICHEINNAMQATRGALVLALEESEASSELASYLSLCKDETQRVVNLVGRMRQIYHPETLEPGPISVDSLFREVAKAASEQLDHNNTRWVEDFATDLQPARGIRDHLYLAFLSMLLNLSETIGSAGGGEMRVSLRVVEGSIQLTLGVDPGLLQVERFLRHGSSCRVHQPRRRSAWAIPCCRDYPGSPGWG